MICEYLWGTALPRHHGEAAWPNLTVGATYALPQRWIDPSWPSRKWGCAQLWLALIHPMQFILITFNNSRLFCTLVLTIWIYLTISIWLISAVHLQVPLWPVQCLQSHQIVLPRVPKQLGSHSLGKPVINLSDIMSSTKAEDIHKAEQYWKRTKKNDKKSFPTTPYMLFCYCFSSSPKETTNTWEAISPRSKTLCPCWFDSHTLHIRVPLQQLCSRPGTVTQLKAHNCILCQDGVSCDKVLLVDDATTSNKQDFYRTHI